MPKSIEQRVRELQDAVELLEKRVAYLEDILDEKLNEFSDEDI